MYVYSAVAALLASACVGTSPYATVVVSISLPSSFVHVIVYVFVVFGVYTALYTTSLVTAGRSASFAYSLVPSFHHANVYVYCASAALLGSAGFAILDPAVPSS